MIWNEVVLNEGEELCHRCDGYGEEKFNPNFIPQFPFTCTVCHGTGKLDWIEKVVGKKKNPNQFKFHINTFYGMSIKKEDSFLKINTLA